MDGKGLGDRLQLVATLGVILGLGLVIWELRQQREFAQAEMTSESHFLTLQQSGERFGDLAVAPILVEACRSPQTLDDTEIALLIYYAGDRLLQAQRIYALGRRSDLYDEQWRFAARSAARELFSIPLLREYRSAGLVASVITDVNEEIDRFLAAQPLPDCLAVLDDGGAIARRIGGAATTD